MIIVEMLIIVVLLLSCVVAYGIGCNDAYMRSKTHRELTKDRRRRIEYRNSDCKKM